MGYDMRWRKVDASEAEAVKAAREVFMAAVAGRDALPDGERGVFNRARAGDDWDAHEAYDGRTARYIAAQDQVTAAMADMDAAEQSYFRLNIRGMGRYRSLMYELGMIFDDAPHPDWPEADDYGITWAEVEAFEYPDDEPGTSLMAADKLEACQRYIADRDRVLAYHAMADTPGIPAHKFGSNDGWIVLPAECQAALALYMGKVQELGEDTVANLVQNTTSSPGYWAKWLAYLNGAITHDGFEVH